MIEKSIQIAIARLDIWICNTLPIIAIVVGGCLLIGACIYLIKRKGWLH